MDTGHLFRDRGSFVTHLLTLIRGEGRWVLLCLCLLTGGGEGGQNGEKVAYVICECSLILPPFQSYCPVYNYGHGLLAGFMFHCCYNLTELNARSK